MMIKVKNTLNYERSVRVFEDNSKTLDLKVDEVKEVDLKLLKKSIRLSPAHELRTRYDIVVVQEQAPVVKIDEVPIVNDQTPPPPADQNPPVVTSDNAPAGDAPKADADKKDSKKGK